MGVIVAAPTAGGAGVLPAVLTVVALGGLFFLWHESGRKRAAKIKS